MQIKLIPVVFRNGRLCCLRERGCALVGNTACPPLSVGSNASVPRQLEPCREAVQSRAVCRGVNVHRLQYCCALWCPQHLEGSSAGCRAAALNSTAPVPPLLAGSGQRELFAEDTRCC